MRGTLPSSPPTAAGPKEMTARELLAKTRPLSRDFFERSPVQVAKDLIGKVLVHQIEGHTLAGNIVENEAYLGVGDQAAHSARGLTGRTQVLFGPPGRAYVFLAYGMYECLNVVTEREGQAGCVLIRALEPVSGLEQIARRRPKARRCRELASGPGKLTLALGITREHNGWDLTRAPLQVRAWRRPSPFELVTTTRIGISRSKELPLRFYMKDSQHVSAR